MFFYFCTADAPRVVIKSDDKKHQRLNCLEHFLHELPCPNKETRIARVYTHI